MLCFPLSCLVFFTVLLLFLYLLLSIQSVRLIPSTLATYFLYLRFTQLNHFTTDGNHQGAHFNNRGTAQAANGFGWETSFKGTGFNVVTVTEGKLTFLFAVWGKKLLLMPSLIWKSKPVSASSHHYRVIKPVFTHYGNEAWKWQKKGKRIKCWGGGDNPMYLHCLCS